MARELLVVVSVTIVQLQSFTLWIIWSFPATDLRTGAKVMLFHIILYGHLHDYNKMKVHLIFCLQR